jgi:hypothetical protein
VFLVSTFKLDSTTHVSHGILRLNILSFLLRRMVLQSLGLFFLCLKKGFYLLSNAFFSVSTPGSFSGFSLVSGGYLLHRGQLLGLLELLHELHLHLLFVSHEHGDTSASATITLIILGVSELIRLGLGPTGLSALVYFLLLRVENRVDRHEGPVLTEGVGN